MPKLGLIAGKGNLPLAVARDAQSKGYSVVAVALEHLAEKELADVADEIAWINAGKIAEIITFLKKAGVSEAVMAGKVPKSLLYKGGISPDLRAIKLLFSLRDKSDDTILLGLAQELAKDGITLLKTTDFTSSLLMPEGVLTKEEPSAGEWKDIEFGWRIAREIGRLDIGQTVVVKNLAVMAIEAIEGTDEAIRRGGGLADGGAVVVKVSKPQQDMRFDVPVVGPDTLNAIREVHGRVLAVEAGKSIILDQEALLREAERAGIAIVGLGSRQPA